MERGPSLTLGSYARWFQYQPRSEALSRTHLDIMLNSESASLQDPESVHCFCISLSSGRPSLWSGRIKTSHTCTFRCVECVSSLDYSGGNLGVKFYQLIMCTRGKESSDHTALKLSLYLSSTQKKCEYGQRFNTSVNVCIFRLKAIYVFNLWNEIVGLRVWIGNDHWEHLIVQVRRKC